MPEQANEQSKEQRVSAPLPDPSGKGCGSSPPTSNDTYNFIADKIGFVPNIRKSDNALQAKIFLGVWLFCILLGAVLGKGDGALRGLIFGIVVALIISGGVLTIVGLMRK